MSTHGTHVTSIIFGQHSSSIPGIAPRCRGLIIPVFTDGGRKLSQLDLSRAIEQAISAGAHIINISGGQLTDFGEAEDWLARAVRLCSDSNILLVAAAGNDGCECLHVPASLPAVLAVGAMDDQGHPIDFSNWGETYQNQGILAPGSNILGAQPGGGTVRLSGTSFATPIVSGVAALLLSLQVQQGETPDPQKVRTALIQSALPCDAADTDSDRCLVGKLNILGALNLLTGGNMEETLESVTASGCGCGGTGASIEPPVAAEAVRPQLQTGDESSEAEIVPAEATAPTVASTQTIPTRPSISTTSTMSNRNSNYVTASQSDASTGGNIVYALGTLG
jgi:cyanobactin maturation PatA/PatG family protease